MDEVFHSSDNFYSHVLMSPTNNMVLIGELLLLDNITIEKLSNMMNQNNSNEGWKGVQELIQFILLPCGRASQTFSTSSRCY